MNNLVGLKEHLMQDDIIQVDLQKKNMKDLIRQERIIDLRKYTLGELMEAIDIYHSGISIHKVNRHQLVAYPTDGRTGTKALSNCVLNIPAIVFIL